MCLYCEILKIKTGANMMGGCLLNEDRIFNNLWYECFSAINACQNIHTVVFFALCALYHVSTTTKAKD